MAKDTKNESLDAITRALKYLRVNPELLVRPSIAVQLTSIGNMLTAIVDIDKENRASIRTKQHKAKLTERATSAERAAVERNAARKQAQAERNAMRRAARAQARKEKLLNTPPRDYSNASRANLRTTYYYYVSHKLPLPQNLEKQLAKTFPGYSLEQHKFTGKRAPKPQPVLNPETTPHIDKRRAKHTAANDNEPLQPFAPIELFSSLNKLSNKYSLRCKSGKTLLRAAAEPYELVFFDAQTQKAVVRKNCGENKYIMHLINCKTYTVAYETRIGGISEISFVPGAHELYTYGANSKQTFAWAYIYGHTPEQRIILPTGRKTISADTTPQHTVIIGLDGATYTTPLIKLPDISKPIAPESSMILTPMAGATVAVKPVESAPQKITAKRAQNHVAPHRTSEPKTIDAPVMPQSADTVMSAQVLNVRLKPVKVDMDKTYYDVYVNGRRIVKNNINTTVKTFLDGTVLGVRGIPGDNASPATCEVWQMFSTDLAERPNMAVDQFTKQRPYIMSVAVGKKEIILTDNKRVKYILDAKRYQKRAQGKIFQIQDEKQK